MRRKVLQDFAHVCCQMFLTSMTNHDRLNLVIFGSGTVWMDFLAQRCTHNRIGISPLHYCVEYRAWLEKQCAKHHVDVHRLTTVELSVEVDVEIERNVRSGIPGWLSTTMELSCSSVIAMEGIDYQAQMQEKQERGLGQIIPGQTY